MSIAVKRLTRDLRDLQKDPLDSNGIYYQHDDVDFLRGRAVIIGPEKTPYQYGYYFFDLFFPEEYPYKPPKVVFQTREGTLRFNPNLYACGKVCVSILNTWSGPQWTACQSIRSVLLSLQSLLNDHPLQNEPGFENDVGERSKAYEAVIRHENFRYAFLEMLTRNIGEFEIFRDVMEKEFCKNYLKMLEWTRDTSMKTEIIRSPIYGMKIMTIYGILLERLVSLTKQKNLNVPEEFIKKRKSNTLDARKGKKIKITKSSWSQLSVADMMERKTVVLIKKHLLLKKIDFDPTLKKKDLCNILWKYYHHKKSKFVKEQDKVKKQEKLKEKEKLKKKEKVKEQEKVKQQEKIEKVQTDIKELTETKDTVKETVKEKKIKQTPSHPAKSFKLNHVEKSQTNNQFYKVCQKKNGVFYWKKLNAKSLKNQKIETV